MLEDRAILTWRTHDTKLNVIGHAITILFYFFLEIALSQTHFNDQFIYTFEFLVAIRKGKGKIGRTDVEIVGCESK